MSKLDEIKPTVNIDGELFYRVELQVEGEWVALASLSKEAICKLADYMCSDELVEVE